MSTTKSHAKKSSKIANQTFNVEAARDRLLNAAVDVFGRLGFEAATTRAIAAAAGTNVQAISYYFNGKEGLYEAAAEYLGRRIGTEHTRTLRTRIAHRLDDVRQQNETIGKDEATALLEQLASALLSIFLNKESEPWARFIIREQMEPTLAFRHLYEQLMKPVLDLTARLVALLLDEPDPSSRYVRLRALSFVGSLLVFRFGHATLLDHVGDPNSDTDVATAMNALARDLAASFHRDGGPCGNGVTS